MYDKYLPVGTVVLLKNATKKVMVTGFCSMAEEDRTKIYDYCGCVYPEGYLTSSQTCLFNHDQIDKIYYMGYQDDEEKQFKLKLKALVDQLGNSMVDMANQTVSNQPEPVIKPVIDPNHQS